MDSLQYTLRVVNHSTQLWDMCLFQDVSELGTDALPVAWFAAPAHPTSTLVFRWRLNYSFVWAPTGPLTPGIYFDAAQLWPADPDVTKPAGPASPGNQVGLSYADGGPLFVTPPATTVPPGTLRISSGPDVPTRLVSVGLAMSGASFVARPIGRGSVVDLTPDPRYLLTAGVISEGQVLDPQTLTGTVPVVFPYDVFSMTATLDANGRWDVAPTVPCQATARRNGRARIDK